MIDLMKCVAEAVMAKGVRGLVELVPGAASLFDVAGDAAKRLRERKRATDLRQEVLNAATATLDEVRQAAAEVAREVAGAGPVEDRLSLEMYLTQIPGTIRRSLQRADDPTGRTVPPDFSLDDAADLLQRLPQRTAAFRPGDPLPGKPGWRLAEFLGTGGFGEVWLARNPTLSALQGAVKFGLAPASRERLLRHEGALINRVMEQGRHANVVQLLDAHLEGDSPWLMYEYVPGGDLTALILAWQALPPADRTRRATDALRTLASAVGHFHRLTPPLVHRDLKPANVLVARVPLSPGLAPGLEGVEPRVNPGQYGELRITDFGIGGIAAAAAIAHEATRRGSTGVLASQLYGSFTPLYASPQQQRGAAPDPRDDVHALGVIGFQMLTGKLDATLGADYAKVLRKLGVPEPLVELLGDCAAHDPDNRPRDASELAARLDGLAHAPQTSVPGSGLANPILTAPAAPPEPESEFEDLPTTSAVSCPQCHAHFRVHIAERTVVCVRCGLGFDPRSHRVGRSYGRRVTSDWEPPAPQASSPGKEPAAPAGPGVWGELARTEPVATATREPAGEAPSPAARLGTAMFPALVWVVMVVPVVVLLVALVAYFRFPRNVPLPEVVSQLTPEPAWDDPVLKHTILAAGEPFVSATVSPDGERVAAITVGQKGSQVQVWSLADGKRVCGIASEPLDDLKGFAWGRDGTRLAVCEASRIRVCSATTGETLVTLAAPGFTLSEVWVSPLGRVVLGRATPTDALAPGRMARILAWDSDSPVSPPRTLTDSDAVPLLLNPGSRFAIDPTGAHFAVASSTKTLVDCGDTENWRATRRFSANTPEAFAFSADGNRLMLFENGNLFRWSTETGAFVASRRVGGESSRPVVSRDNRWLVTVGSGQLWDLNGDAAGQELRGQNTRLTRAAFNPGGTVLATLYEDGSVQLCDPANGGRPRKMIAGHAGTPRDIAFTPDGNTLVGTGDAGIFVWSVPNPK